MDPKTTHVVEWHDSAHSVVKKDYYIDDSGKLHGIYKSFYSNGKLSTHEEYRNGKLWNIMAAYDSNGKRLDFGDLKDGNGLVKLYTKGGTLAMQGEYKDGQRDGIWLLFLDNGENEVEYWYRDGYLIDESGNILQEGVEN